MRRERRRGAAERDEVARQDGEERERDLDRHEQRDDQPVHPQRRRGALDPHHAHIPLRPDGGLVPGAAATGGQRRPARGCHIRAIVSTTGGSKWTPKKQLISFLFFFEPLNGIGLLFGVGDRLNCLPAVIRCTTIIVVY